MTEKDERTIEQLYRSAVSGLYARLKSNYDYLHRRFGDEGIKLIADMSREYGLSIAAMKWIDEVIDKNKLSTVS